MSRILPIALLTVVLACSDDGAGGAGAQAAGGSPATGGAAEVGGGATGGAGGATGGAGVGGQGGDGGAAGGISEGGMGGDSSTGGGGGVSPACDLDGDTQLAEQQNCCGAPDACDCDDSDPDVFPGQGAYFQVPRPFVDDPVLQWDYNCDGVAEKEYVQSTGCGLLACAGTSTKFQGNNGDYFCGAPGTLIVCAGLGLQCTAQGGVSLPCR